VIDLLRTELISLHFTLQTDIGLNTQEAC